MSFLSQEDEVLNLQSQLQPTTSSSSQDCRQRCPVDYCQQIEMLVSGVVWTWTPLAGSGLGRSARIQGVGGG